MVERVIFPFRGAELGGSHVATFTFAKALQRRFPVECVGVCPADTLIMSEASRHGLRVVSSGEAPTGRNNMFTDVSWAQRRRSLLETEKTSGGTIVHCNDINTLRSWGLAARLADMSVVYHHHALNRIWWPPHLLSLSHADAIICVSDSTRDAIRRWRGDAVKELNPFDIDVGHDRHAARRSVLREFGWPPDAIVVGWIGNFWKRKRPVFFLKVASELYRRDTRYRFILFGRDGDYSVHDIQQHAMARGVVEATVVPGFRQPVETNLACLDLLLAPAPREPFGRALVEAIVLGTPIVATRGAGHSEIIGAWGGGELANQDDTAEDVAILCRQVLAAPDRYRLAAAKRAQISADLAPDAYAERMLGIYESIPRRHSRRTKTEAASPVTSKSSVPLA